MERRIVFPGFMERCCGFTIPKQGVFYAFYFEDCLARFDVTRERAVEIDDEYEFNETESTITFNNLTRPFLGLWGGRPLQSRNDLGQLTLSGGRVQLTTPSGEVLNWQFKNFSGDWEHVTFDSDSAAFLFGTPYDFDFRYIELP